MSDTIATLGDHFASEVVSAEFILTLDDRNALPNHDALMFMGSVDGTSSMVKKVPHSGLGGADQPDPAAAGSQVTTQPITTGSTSITVSRYSKGYGTADEVRMVQNADRLGMQPLTLDALSSYFMRMTSLIANVGDDFTVTGGPGSGNDMTVLSLLSVIGAIVVNNVDGSAGYMANLHGQQWRDFMVNGGATLAAGWVVQDPERMYELTRLKGGAYKGTWMGVDWNVSNQVPTANAGADRAGCIFGTGGILWADGRHTGVDVNPADMFLIGEGRVLFERDRQAKAGATDYVMHGYLGVSKGIEAGVTVISDA